VRPWEGFDCVNCGIKVAKLELYGISGKFPTLIQHYLTVRHQEVFIATINAYDGVFSSCKNVINGVLLGLIVCSLLLLVYFNDLPKITDNYAKVVPFADDTSITVTTCN
jgi:hypothetical protein